MTNQTLEASHEATSSIDERIEILARELELAIKWQRPCVLLVVYSSEYVRSDVETALENDLIDLGQKAVHLQLKDQPTAGVVSFLREFKDPENAVFFVHGLHWGQPNATATYSTLNLQQEFFIERQIRAVFWLTQNEIVNLARSAPDFWAYRHRVIEFVESPKAERLLQAALESAWRGTGEYVEPYEDTDAKISLRESLLTELPDREEASSQRANLLLTLGILNWRKGDFERAAEQLQNALKIAGRMEDNWFEAECYNALALVWTSTERSDEAIDAYKQAIRLAPDQIFAWNNLGNLCVKIGRNDEAMLAFRKAVECNPKDAIAWNGLANLYFGLGYVDDAIAAYRNAIQYMPTFAQPWNGLGDVYAGMGRSDEAMKAYHQSIELNNQYVTPWIRLGILYTRQERYREAAKAYRQALSLNPQSSRLWNDLGNTYLKTEALEDAAEAFLKAIDLDRGYGWAYSNLAYTYTLQGKYKETVSLLLRSIELLKTDKDKAVSWNRLGSAYRLLNEYDNAMTAYQMADQLDRGNAIARQNESALLEKAATLAPEPEPEPEPTAAIPEPDVTATADEATVAETQPDVEQPAQQPAEEQPAQSAPAALAPDIQDAPSWLLPSHDEVSPAQAEQSIESGSATASTETVQTTEGKAEEMDAWKWNDTGNACFGRGAFDEAIADYNRAIQLDPLFGIAYSNLALAYLNQGRFTEAILLFQKSIDLLHSNTEKAVSWNGLGHAYRCINDYANARTAYQRAAELDPATAGIRDRADDYQATQRPQNAQGWNDLGELFVKTGSVNEAVHAFQHAIEMDPHAAGAYGNLAHALVSQSKYREAIPVYEKNIGLLQNNKDKAAAWNRLGNAYRKLNDYENAIKAYQKAVVLADEGVDLLTRTRFSLLSNCYVNP